jgi:hypothetical protein
LTPEVSAALQTVVTSGEIADALGSDLTLHGVNIGGTQIEVVASHVRQQRYAITLVLEGAESGTPDGKGDQFFYYLDQAGRSRPLIAKALLTAASVIDQAVPASALITCTENAQPSPEPQSPVDPFGSSLRLALLSAATQIIVVVAAIAVGRRISRNR